MGRLTFANLSTENLLHNVDVIKKKVYPAKVIAMVKANAYGHGIRSVSMRLDGHVDLLGVASIEEALALRKVGVRTPILLIEGVFEPHEFSLASAEGFHITFHSQVQVDWLKKAAPLRPIQAWIKVNTGMGRLGFSPSQVPLIFKELSQSPYRLGPLRIISHLACSEDRDHPLNLAQTRVFKELALPAELSLCASAGILNFPGDYHDYVRPGLLLYGLSPIKGRTGEDWGLKPVMTLRSTLIAINHLNKGDSVGYGARYICPEDMRVGVVAIGYGDGYPFTAQDGAPVLVNQSLCPLIGRVSMDMLTVDLRPCPQAQVGDLVTLWGQGLPLEIVSEYTHNIPYDIITGVQHRVQFLWTKL